MISSGDSLYGLPDADRCLCSYEERKCYRNRADDEYAAWQLRRGNKGLDRA